MTYWELHDIIRYLERTGAIKKKEFVFVSSVFRQCFEALDVAT